MVVHYLSWPLARVSTGKIHPVQAVHLFEFVEDGPPLSPPTSVQPEPCLASNSHLPLCIAALQ